MDWTCPNRHDPLFKDLLREFPADFLRLVGADFADLLDLDDLRFERTEIFFESPPEPGSPYPVNFTAKARPRDPRGRPVRIHIGVHPRYRAEAPANLQLHNCLLWRHYRQPVHSFVLWLQGGPAGLTDREYRKASLGREIFRFHYRSLGLSGAPAELFLARPEPLAWAFAALMKPPTGDPLALRHACLARIAAMPVHEDLQRNLLYRCVAAYLELDGGAGEEMEALIAEQPGIEEWKRLTYLEQIQARGERRGRRAGMQDLLLRLLGQRFAPLPRTAVDRVRLTATPEELARLADGALTAGSLEELGLA